MSRLRGLLLFAGYQAAWWAAALLAREDRATLGTVIMLGFAATALAFDRRKKARAALMAVSLATGIVVDGGLRVAGFLAFPPALDAAPSPPFMMAIWIGFAAVIPIPFVSARPLVGAVAGALGGLLAYRGGEALELLTFVGGPSATLAVAVAWAIALPLLGWLSLRLEVEPRAVDASV